MRKVVQDLKKNKSTRIHNNRSTEVQKAKLENVDSIKVRKYIDTKEKTKKYRSTQIQH